MAARKHPPTCLHPPIRLYSWWAYNLITNKNDWLCISCCACGTSLQGSNDEYEAYLQRAGIHVPGDPSP